jgi:hypothetical protein
MSPFDEQVQKERFHDPQVRKEVKEIIDRGQDILSEIESYLGKNPTPSRILNTSIPIIEAIKVEKISASRFERFFDFNEFILKGYIQDDGCVTSIPFYFSAPKVLMSKYLWVEHFILPSPMYFFLPNDLSFKVQLDYHLRTYSNEYARYRLLRDLRMMSLNSIKFLEARLSYLETLSPYLKDYTSHIRSVLSAVKDIQFIIESYLVPLMSIPVEKLQGDLKGVLPTWKKSPQSLQRLFNALKKNFVDPATSEQAFFELFSGKDLSTIQRKVKWVDLNPKNGEPTSSSILKLFKILSYHDFIDFRYSQDGGLVRSIVHICFEDAKGKTPKKNSMKTAWSTIKGSSQKYKELEKLIHAL